MKEEILGDLSDHVMLLRRHRLFAECDKQKLTQALSQGHYQKVEYACNSPICSPELTDKRMIILLSGSASVYTADEGRNILMRKLFPGDIIGVANLFSKEEYVSRVIAKKKCITLEFSAEQFGKLMEQDPSLLYSYISFLSERICYLNRKILFLTAGSAERRLAHFLASSAKQDGDKLTIRMNALCEMLNLGRASLYRAADALVSEGFIKRDGKTIVILNRQQMLKKYN